MSEKLFFSVLLAVSLSRAPLSPRQSFPLSAENRCGDLMHLREAFN
jgi:hypothetical protein